MKTITLITIMSIAVAIVVTGCSKNDTPSSSMPDGYEPSTAPIAFASEDNWSDAAEQTKSVGLIDEFKENDNIGVIGYHLASNGGAAPTELSDVATPNFMYNQKMVYDGSNWSYSPLKYWPNNSNDRLQFFAYYPYNSCVALSGNNTNGYPKITYTPKTHPNLHEDFITATTELLSKDNDIVKFNFKHQLTQIRFSGAYETTKESADINVNVLSVKLGGIYSTTGAFTSDGFEWVEKSGENIVVIADLDRWELNNNYLKKYVEPASDKDISIAYTDLSDKDDVGLMLVPSQVLDEDEQIYLDITFIYKDESIISQRIYYDNTALKKDQAGKSVRFLFRLNVDNIESSTGIFTYDDWIEEEANGGNDITINNKKDE